MKQSWASFMRSLPAAVAARLGTKALPHKVAWSSQMKVWSGNRDLHYEATLRPRLNVIELGLHFESDPLTNQRLLGAFRSRAKAIAKAIPTARIETWDRGWARVWEPIELVALDERFATLIAERLATYVRVLEPILLDELPTDVAWEEEPRRAKSASAVARPRPPRSRSR